MENDMQDLEELKKSISVYGVHVDYAFLPDLIARCESAEKDRDDWKLHAERQTKDATARMIQAMENGAAANALRAELKELREQKPVRWAWRMPDGSIGKKLYDSKEEAIRLFGPFIVGEPFPIYAAPISQSRNNTESMSEIGVSQTSISARVGNRHLVKNVYEAYEAGKIDGAQSRDSAEPLIASDDMVLMFIQSLHDEAITLDEFTDVRKGLDTVFAYFKLSQSNANAHSEPESHEELQDKAEILQMLFESVEPHFGNGLPHSVVESVDFLREHWFATRDQQSPAVAVPDGFTVEVIDHPNKYGFDVRGKNYGYCVWKDDLTLLWHFFDAMLSASPKASAEQQPAVPDVPSNEMLYVGTATMRRGLKLFGDNYAQIVSNIWEDMHHEFISAQDEGKQS
jgi:hypothetical protein